MKKFLVSLLFALSAFGQSSNATVSGTLSDSTGAVLPGVYSISAELPGFQTQTYTAVQLGTAAQVRLNFALQVAGQTQAVEVTITPDTLLATSSSSVGHVLPETKVRDLPLT